MGNYLCKDAEHSKQVKKSNCDNSMLPACEKEIKNDVAVVEENPDIPFADSVTESDDIDKEKQNGEHQEHIEDLKLNGVIHEVAEEGNNVVPTVDCLQQHMEEKPDHDHADEHKDVEQDFEHAVKEHQIDAVVQDVKVDESSEEHIHEHLEVELAIEDVKFQEEPSIASFEDCNHENVDSKEELSIESSQDHFHEHVDIETEPSVVKEHLEIEEDQHVESAAQNVNMSDEEPSLEEFIHKEIEIKEESSIQSSEDSCQEHLNTVEDCGGECEKERPVHSIESFVAECEEGNATESSIENEDSVSIEEDDQRKTNLEEQTSLADVNNHFESVNDSIHGDTEPDVDSCEDVHDFGKCSSEESDNLCVSNDVQCALEEELNEIALNTVEEVMHDAKERLRCEVESSSC